VANEIAVSASLSVNKATAMSGAIARSIAAGSYNMSGTYHSEGTLLVATAATAVPLGQVTAPHWAWFKNLDATNFVTVRNGAAGADLIKLLAGEIAMVPLLDTSAPYAVANTAAVLLEYAIFSL
jgi:hypothetical protein